jgi:tape measure domain-containing protein
VTFNAGTLVATIQLSGKSKFDADLASSGRAFTNTSSLADKAGKAISDTFKGASIAAGVAAAATTAYVTSLFRTGVAYNQLQQQSRAALTTILGGTQAANDQMDKLDAFAKTSPFAKSVFITAQQQLLGFGLQAQKVIPALTAIQDAVAAVGGSNDQISQITYALAQMLGQGKLTGETLNQLGQYGIDAATLIGQKMGKTGQDIRDMASSPGGIPVDQVWDPLISGLEDRFAGASANVKATWSGTTDRIKAASRDIGSALAAPFVDPHGGGQAITWGNQVADIMRSVQSKLTPILSMVTGLLEPAFDSITNHLDAAKSVINGWDPGSLVTTFEKISQYSGAIGGIGGAVAAMNLGLLKSIPVLGSFLPAINPVAAAFAGIVLSSPEMRDALKDLLAAFKPLIPVAANIAGILARDLQASLPGIATGIDGIAHVLGPLVSLLAGVPTPLLLAVGGFVAFQKVQQPLAYGLLDAGVKLEGFLGKLGGVGGKFGGLINAFQNTAGFLSGPWGLAVGGAAALLIGQFFDNMAQAKQKVDDYTQSLDENTGAITDNTKASAFNNLQKAGALDAGAKVGLDSKTLVDASLGDAKARAAVQAAQDAAAKQYGKNAKPGEAGGDLLAAANKAADAVGVESNSIKESIKIKQQWLETTSASKKALDDASDSQAKFNDAVKQNGVDTDTSSAAYKANKQALDDLGAKAADYVTTVKNQTQSTYDTKQAQAEMAQSLVASAEQMGMSQQAAIDYTAKILGIPPSRVTETAVTGVGESAAGAKTVQDAVNAIPGNKPVKVTVDAYGAFATLDELNAYLNQLASKEITVGGSAAGYYGFRQANGGVVDYYAKGGVREHHVAQIAPAGAWRVWAEPETGGEAYIPLASGAKRSRALDVWAEAGRRIGALPFANGGVALGSARATAFAIPPQSHVAAGAPVSVPASGNAFDSGKIPPIQVYANDPEAAGLSVFRRISMLGA